MRPEEYGWFWWVTLILEDAVLITCLWAAVSFHRIAGYMKRIANALLKASEVERGISLVKEDE